MKRNKSFRRGQGSAGASVLQTILCVTLICISAILFASSFRAAPQSASDGFYPPLPVPARPTLASQNGFYPPLPATPNATPFPVTVALPIDTLDAGIPASTVLIEPVTTTLIDSTTTGGTNLI